MEYKTISLKKNVLLLQGPAGPFFNRFKTFLKAQGVTVYKINLHLGEHIFYYENAILYNGMPQEWYFFIRDFLFENDIKQVFCLGKNKFYNKTAMDVCLSNNIEFFVFEEGLIRPNFITLEKISEKSFSLKNILDIHKVNLIDFVNPPCKSFRRIRLAYNRYLQWQWTLIYGLGLGVNQFINPHYHHHLPYKGLRSFHKWVIVALRLFISEYTPFKDIKNNSWCIKNKKNYYIVALQINTDAAVVYNKMINSMNAFIEKVLVSFAKSAPKDTLIVLKHHPYDKGWNNYRSYIKKLEKQLRIEGRVKYIFNCDLSLTLKNSKGCVVLNSTLGMTALELGIPTVALSEDAYYNYEGLTYQMGIDNFWSDLQPPDHSVFALFYKNLIYHSQILGSFYSGQLQLVKKFQYDYSCAGLEAHKELSEDNVN